MSGKLSSSSSSAETFPYISDCSLFLLFLPASPSWLSALDFSVGLSSGVGKLSLRLAGGCFCFAWGVKWRLFRDLGSGSNSGSVRVVNGIRGLEHGFKDIGWVIIARYIAGYMVQVPQNLVTSHLSFVYFFSQLLRLDHRNYGNWLLGQGSRSCCTLRPQFWYVPELCNFGTYRNCLSHVAILECTGIVQFWYVPELSNYTILVCTRFLPELLLQFWDVPELSVNYFPIACWMTP